jgi:Dolichyl-phosphate-mannose-protein mannosyltransferase
MEACRGFATRRTMPSELALETTHMHVPPARLPSWQGWVAYSLLFLIFVTITYEHSKAWNQPNKGDQDLDLTLGLKIRNFEALSDGYHHPLLPALVAPFAEKHLRYFATAKLINIAIGATAFWVIAWVGRRLVGPIPTFLTLVAISPGLSNKSAEFTAEPLLLLLTVLTFYGLIRGFAQPRYWIMAGIAAGLAYLTKGSGLLLPLAYALTVFRFAPKLTLTARFWLFPLAFVVVAAPLLVYNWQVFGSPIFNYNTAHVIWLDYTEEQMIMFDQGPPTMFSYLATHSLGDILRRLFKGFVIVRGVEWVWPFLVIFVLIPKRWLAYFQMPSAKQPMVTAATTLVLTFYLPFSWSAVVQRGIRYLLPIFPIMFLLLADVLVFYGGLVARRWWSPKLQKRLGSLAMFGLLAVLGGVWLVQVASHDFQAPLAIDFEDQATAEVYRLLDTPHFAGKQVLFGPSHQLTGTWLFRNPVAFPLIPPGLPAAEFVAWLERTGIDYILANAEMVKRRQYSVGDYLAYSPSEGVQIRRLEPEWEVIYRAPAPSKFVLIRVR